MRNPQLRLLLLQNVRIRYVLPALCPFNRLPILYGALPFDILLLSRVLYTSPDLGKGTGRCAEGAFFQKYCTEGLLVLRKKIFY